MSSKTKEAYWEIFRTIAFTHDISPLTIMSDYEAGLQNALVESFPDATVLGCWFHFGNVNCLHIFNYDPLYNNNAKHLCF